MPRVLDHLSSFTSSCSFSPRSFLRRLHSSGDSSSASQPTEPDLEAPPPQTTAIAPMGIDSGTAAHLSSFTSSCAFSPRSFLRRLLSSGDSSSASQPTEPDLEAPPLQTTAIAPMGIDSGTAAHLSSFTSSCSFSPRSFLRRLLSSGDSSSTSQPTEPNLEAPPPQTTAIAPMGIDSGTAAHRAAPEIVGGDGIRDATADAKRVAKLVQPVTLAVAAGSLVLFVNAPPVDAKHPELGVAHAADIAFVCLGLFTSLGLSMHAVVRSSLDPRVAELHKRLLLAAIAFVLCAAVVRLVVRFSLVLPGAAPLQFFLAFLLLGSLASLLFLHVAGKIAQGDHTGANARA